MPDNNKIKLINTELGYQSKKRKNILLKNLNISAERGENIALIGVNGSGKSTLLRTLANLQNPLSGDIYIDSIKLNNYSAVESAKKLSFVSSEIIRTRFLKVYDLVSLGRFPHQNFSNGNSEEDHTIIRKAMKITGITELQNRNINEISDGERQKVMIARALAQDTDIILLDEPTAFLDISNKFAVYNILSKTSNEQNKTIIFSTHDLNIALKHADKIWLIKDKKIYEGAPEDLIIENVFHKLFTNENVFFNKLTNEFSVKFPQKYPVKLINYSESELIKQITINALKRKLYFVSDRDNIPEITINQDNTWNLSINEEIFLLDSIYKLLKHLQN